MNQDLMMEQDEMMMMMGDQSHIPVIGGGRHTKNQAVDRAQMNVGTAPPKNQQPSQP